MMGTARQPSAILSSCVFTGVMLTCSLCIHPLISSAATISAAASSSVLASGAALGLGSGSSPFGSSRNSWEHPADSSSSSSSSSSSKTLSASQQQQHQQLGISSSARFTADTRPAESDPQHHSSLTESINRTAFHALAKVPSSKHHFVAGSVAVASQKSSRGAESSAQSVAVDGSTGERNGLLDSMDSVGGHDQQFSTLQFQYSINEPSNYCQSGLFTVIFVGSAPHNSGPRNTIRQSWGSVSGESKWRTKVIFMLGLPGRRSHLDQKRENRTEVRMGHWLLDEEAQSLLLQESQQFNDIVQAEFVDAYANLTLKSLAILHWMDTFCPKVKFLVKADDDTFLNTHLLLTDLHNTVHDHFIMGDVIAGARPIRDHHSKYYTPRSVFSGVMYPKYISGSAYVIAADLIHSLCQASRNMKLFWLEDVYITGLLARKVGAKHIFNGKFGFRQPYLKPCWLSDRIIALHRLTPAQIMAAWKLALKNVKCKMP